MKIHDHCLMGFVLCCSMIASSICHAEEPPVPTRIFIESDREIVGQFIFQFEKPIEPKPLTVKSYYQPLFKAHSVLVDTLTLEILDRLLGLDMPDTATPYRTHGGVI